jgi:hypothetical protein
MALTGPADGPPRLPPGDPMTAIDLLVSQVEMAAARIGRPVRLDPRLLTERAALTGLRRQGRIACGGGARLVEARDGWLAVNLPRESDRLSLPAWLGPGLPDDAWAAVARGARGRSLADLVESGRRLDLAVSAVGGLAVPAEPFTLRRMVLGPRRRVAEPPLVVDLSALWAGPLCGQILGEAGARVIKVESVGRPDPVRQSAPAFFDRLNAGKDSVVFDFKDPADLARLRGLLGRADVVVTSARARAFAQLGLDPETVFADNPGLVWVAITAHGWDSNAVGFGDDVAAGAGLVAFDGSGAPLFAGDALADPLTGLAAAGGALRALGQGGGVLVDASLAAAAAFVASFPAPPAAGGLVHRAPDGWRVETQGGSALIVAPRARPWPGPAAAFGADTARWVA